MEGGRASLFKNSAERRHLDDSVALKTSKSLLQYEGRSCLFLFKYGWTIRIVGVTKLIQARRYSTRQSEPPKEAASANDELGSTQALALFDFEGFVLIPPWCDGVIDILLEY